MDTDKVLELIKSCDKVLSAIPHISFLDFLPPELRDIIKDMIAKVDEVKADLFLEGKYPPGS